MAPSAKHSLLGMTVRRLANGLGERRSRRLRPRPLGSVEGVTSPLAPRGHAGATPSDSETSAGPSASQGTDTTSCLTSCLSSLASKVTRFCEAAVALLASSPTCGARLPVSESRRQGATSTHRHRMSSCKKEELIK